MDYQEVFEQILASSIRIKPDLRGSSLETAIRMSLGLDISSHPKQFYKFNNEFARELAKVSVNKIMGDSLFDGFCAAFRFLSCYIFVRVIKKEELTPTPSGKMAIGVIAAFVIQDIKSKLNFPESHYFLIPFGGDFVEDAGVSFESCKTNLPAEEDTPHLQSAFKWVLNSLAYIHSGKPDLRNYTAPKKEDKQTSRKEKDRIVNEFGNEDAILVSWGWKKPIICHMNNWEVSGHFWWKPYGPERKLRMLDWREGHLRSRQNDGRLENGIKEASRT
jgi:hypothetical protein